MSPRHNKSGPGGEGGFKSSFSKTFQQVTDFLIDRLQTAARPLARAQEWVFAKLGLLARGEQQFWGPTYECDSHMGEGHRKNFLMLSLLA